MLEELGFGHVRSVISSGNVLFESDSTDADALGDRIETAWPTLRGFSATTIVKSRDQLAEILAGNPFADLPHGPSSYQLVTFFKRPTAPGIDLPHRPDGHAFELDGFAHNAVFTVSDTTATRTPDVMTWLEKRYGKENTSRTPLTVRRILDRLG